MVPSTTTEHAQAMLAYINVSVAPLGIVFKARITNVVWLLCLGCGSLAAAFDVLLYAAYNSFNIALCDDDQILNLLPVAGTSRIPGSASTLVVTFTAASTGPLTVPAGTQVRVTGEDYLFETDSALALLANEKGTVPSTCNILGPNLVLPGAVTAIVGSLANFGSVTNVGSSIPGADQETVAAVRTRLIKGQTTRHNIDGLAVALRSLVGIQYASVYYNYSLVTAITLPGGISLPARHLMFVVKGTSLYLAKTYAENILAPSYGTQTQNYVTNSGQTLAISYENAVNQPVYIRVYIDSTQRYEPNYDLEIIALLVAASSSTIIGQAVTQEFVLGILKDFPFAAITGAEVSANGITYGRSCVVSAIAIGVISSSNIEVIEE